MMMIILAGNVCITQEIYVEKLAGGKIGKISRNFSFNEITKCLIGVRGRGAEVDDGQMKHNKKFVKIIIIFVYYKFFPGKNGKFSKNFPKMRERRGNL